MVDRTEREALAEVEAAWKATGQMVCIPLAVARIIDGAFLPTNPNKLRSATFEVKAAAHEFKAALAAIAALTPPSGE